MVNRAIADILIIIYLSISATAMFYLGSKFPEASQHKKFENLVVWLASLILPVLLTLLYIKKLQKNERIR